MTKPVYYNTPEALAKYISPRSWDRFYSTVLFNSDRTHKNFCELTNDEQINIGTLAEFFVKSDEVTPAIKGYYAVALPETSLCAYIPKSFVETIGDYIEEACFVI